MSFDPDVIQMIRAVLDSNYPAADGGAKQLRYFTAADCRAHAASTNNPAAAELADVIDEADLVTLGEAIARVEALDEGHSCPRCDFERSIVGVVYCGEFIESHYEADQHGRLSEPELQLLTLCREWLADDTISRCLEEADG